jgi:hypothetical protein
MNNMILHCGGQFATFEEIAGIEVPDGTETYRPVPHGDLVRLICHEVNDRFGLTKPEMKFGLNKGKNGLPGQQLFGTLTYRLADETAALCEAFAGNVNVQQMQQYGYTVAVRNSYDKTMSVGVCGGVNTFICDNLSFYGSDFTIKMKHTKNVWDTVVPQVMVKVKNSVGDFVKTITFLENLKAEPTNSDDVFETIGRAWGHGVLTIGQAKGALHEFRRCRDDEGHDFHEHRWSAYGLYQNFTQALKLGKAMNRKLDQYTGVSEIFEDKFLKERRLR